jgi:hypothetical protein
MMPISIVWRLTRNGSYSSKVGLQCLFPWFHPLCSLETNLEILGSSSLQVLHLACIKELFLNGGPALTKRGLPTRLLAPSVIKRRRPYSTYWFHLFSPSKSGSSFCRLQKIGLASIAPQPSTHRFWSWWYQALAVKEVTMDYKKGFNSLAILVAWEIWKYRATVFLMALLQALQRCCKQSLTSASFGAQPEQRTSWSFLEGLWEGLRQ